MARFCSLFSGSSGNAYYIGTSQRGLLFDAGVSCKRLTEAMQKRSLDPSMLLGVFVTHEHIDHVRGLQVFLKKYRIPLYTTEGTLRYLEDAGQLPEDCEITVIRAGQTVSVDDFAITCFPTSHDAMESVGYRVTMKDGRVLSIATDLGYVSDEVRQAVFGSDLVVLESNYDLRMLQCGPYPYPLKQRISSHRGHLSNDDAAAFAAELVAKGTTRLVLAHLSEQNNHPQLAFESMRTALLEKGYELDRDYLLTVAPRHNPGEMIVL